MILVHTKGTEHTAGAERLTTQEHWEEIYSAGLTAPRRVSLGQHFRRWLKARLGYPAENYTEHVLWHGLYPRFLPSLPGLKVVEVGSAPGWNLIKFHRLRGYDPYGIEYAPAGVEANRRKFRGAEIDPSHVIAADFFSSELASQFHEYFDVVYSSGFIEHFADPRDVIQRHLNLLKPSGTLVITIPNFSGFNYHLGKFFNAQNIALHNIAIMNRSTFSTYFVGLPLATLYCNYYGTLYFGLFQPENVWYKKLLYRLLVRLQIGVNIFCYWAFGARGCERPWLSPYLIYIGRKL